MNSKDESTIGRIKITGETLECFNKAPIEALRIMAIIASSMLSGISTGALRTPPKSDAEMMLLMLMTLSVEARVLISSKQGEESPEETVDDVSQAADLLKKFSLH